MISIRRYLEGDAAAAEHEPNQIEAPGPAVQRRPWLDAYRGTLEAFAQAGSEACPSAAQELRAALAGARDELKPEPADPGPVSLRIQEQVRDWGRRVSALLRTQATEVKQMLLAMASTAQSVSERDVRCAAEMEALTTNLRAVASLEDLAQIRCSIEQSAREIKGSIDRMTSEGREVLEQMQGKIAEFQTRMEQAEQAASVDGLTHLRTRMWMEGQLEERVAQGAQFCVAVVDLDGFKFVNDRYGHLAGDELLRQFAAELRASCRSTDLVGRWGGDEFLILLDGALDTAQAQLERVRKWVCGSYELADRQVKLNVEASMGLASFAPPETLEELLDRADKAMYAHKSSRR